MKTPPGGTWTVEDAVAAIKKDGLPPHVNTLEERINYGLALERLPRREATGHIGIAYLVGPAVFTSYTQYKRARTVVLAAKSTLRPPDVIEAARKALDQLTAGTITVSGAYDLLKAAEKAEADAHPMGWTAEYNTDGLPKLPPPDPTARARPARALRIQWVRALAKQGATSYEIAERLRIGRQAVWKLSKDADIAIPADKVLHKTLHRAHDPNRAMGVVADDLAALVWSLERIDLNGLDPAQTAVWAAQLHDHALTIRRISRRISPKKENT